ncbi:MAG TPA: hypothetical protein VLF67_03800 [Candidatus Saccharimonas sp.]|nr:hypothetical protein [Candidatus Saccharimonas sp.]
MANDDGATCGDCRGTAKLAGIAVGAGYDGPVREAILQLKFERGRGAAAVLAELVAERVPQGVADVVTAVPVAPVRYRERGYNQAELLGRAVAQRLGRPYRPLLERVTAEHQVGHGRAERLTQVSGAFYTVRNLDGERVLVVDDVTTTGATLAECAAVLDEAGAGAIWGAAVARGA